MEKKNPTQHRMTRRAAAHDYTRPGIYHITLHVADSLGQPLGVIAGSLSAPDGSPDAPRTALSPVGQMVQHELLTAIHEHYPMVEVQDYVIMPEHLHFIAVVQGKIQSRNGKAMALGQVIAGFKKGCNRRYWEMTGQTAVSGQTICSGGTAAHTVPGGSPAGNKAPSDGTSGRPPLFNAGYCDVMPIDAAQLATQRAYIAANPRSRLLRSSHRDWLQAHRGGIDTALTPSALLGYLRRECGAALTPAAWKELAEQLLMAPDGTITCDSFGSRQLMDARLLPVVCHRKDTSRFGEQKRRCMEEAAHGAVLVSARIAKGEQEIMDEAVNRGFPAIIIADNGFPDRYHPSAERLDLCAAGRLLLVTPWRYQYRSKDESIHVPRCKTMNCVAQALCRTPDTWWKSSMPGGETAPNAMPGGETAGNMVPCGSPAGN